METKMENEIELELWPSLGVTVQGSGLSILRPVLDTGREHFRPRPSNEPKAFI